MKSVWLRSFSSLLPLSLALPSACHSADSPAGRAGSFTEGGSSLGGEAAGGNGASGPHDDGHLIVVTERESPEVAMQYLHVLKEWPEDGNLRYERAIELGEFVNVRALGNTVFVHQPADATVRKIPIASDGSIGQEETISFARYGVTGFSGDMVYASPTRAYFVDEAAGLMVIWDPEAMSVVGEVELPEEAITRDDMASQISRGIALDDEGFVSVSWRNWETLAYRDVAALGVFDATSEAPELRLVEDARCASTVTTPFAGGDGYVYLVSDAALGFDALANPNRTEKALCVLRFEPGAGGFDPGFFLDLRSVLGSPGFYAVHPMKGGKLLVNLWAPDVDLESVADPTDSGWYWDYPPYFEYAIVDLASGTASPVSDIPRAAVQWSVTLEVDGDSYVQAYRDDGGSDLSRVDPDGTVTKVLSNPSATDVQYLGRVGD